MPNIRPLIAVMTPSLPAYERWKRESQLSDEILYRVPMRWGDSFQSLTFISVMCLHNWQQGYPDPAATLIAVKARLIDARTGRTVVDQMTAAASLIAAEELQREAAERRAAQNFDIRTTQMVLNSRGISIDLTGRMTADCIDALVAMIRWDDAAGNVGNNFIGWYLQYCAFRFAPPHTNVRFPEPPPENVSRPLLSLFPDRLVDEALREIDLTDAQVNNIGALDRRRLALEHYRYRYMEMAGYSRSDLVPYRERLRVRIRDSLVRHAPPLNPFRLGGERDVDDRGDWSIPEPATVPAPGRVVEQPGLIDRIQPPPTLSGPLESPTLYDPVARDDALRRTMRDMQEAEQRHSELRRRSRNSRFTTPPSHDEPPGRQRPIRRPFVDD